VRQLRRIRYDVPPQDLRVDLTRIPALPASGFILSNVRRATLET
jgi:fatty-acid peroxygenase